jgi:hypothetical protein
MATHGVRKVEFDVVSAKEMLNPRWNSQLPLPPKITVFNFTIRSDHPAVSCFLVKAESKRQGIFIRRPTGCPRIDFELGSGMRHYCRNEWRGACASLGLRTRPEPSAIRNTCAHGGGVATGINHLCTRQLSIAWDFCRSYETGGPCATRS